MRAVRNGWLVCVVAAAAFAAGLWFGSARESNAQVPVLAGGNEVRYTLHQPAEGRAILLHTWTGMTWRLRPDEVWAPMGRVDPQERR